MIWNKGLTSETSESVAKHAKSLREYYKTHKGTWAGKKLSAEMKAKISAGRKKYIEEHPEKNPALLRHSSHESYPEKYFRKWLKKENLFEKQEFQISRYSLDFAWPDKKIYLEIDGGQHKLDWMIEHDNERTGYLNSLGWICIGRVDWPWYKTLSNKEKHKYLGSLKNAIIKSKFIEKFISKKELENQKRQNLIDAGYVNSLGRAAPLKLLNNVWQARLNQIIESNIDLTKYGWKEKVLSITGLTRRQLNDTIEHFPEYFKDKYIRGK